jgi:hypothetical protein
MDTRHPMVAIALKPERVSKQLKQMFGVGIEKDGKITLTKAQDTLYAKNLRITTANLFQNFSYHVSAKIIKAFQTESDPSGGRKWKKLSREAIALRSGLQSQYDRAYADKGFKGRRKKVQASGKDSKPLYLTGKLFEVVTGKRMRTMAGGYGRQRAGNLGKDGIQLTLYAGYRRGGLMQHGAFSWSLDGPKTRHLVGFKEYFVNVMGDGTEKEREQYPVPARPYVPKFSNAFMSSFVRKSVSKRYQSWILATEKGSTQIIGDASVRGLSF